MVYQLSGPMANASDFESIGVGFDSRPKPLSFFVFGDEITHIIDYHIRLGNHTKSVIRYYIGDYS